tara:strand:+ start:1412 stop:2746 length:1335 start_codon:yes stop_codon:yes gene_type:complete
MCGIYGIYNRREGNREVMNELIDGLKKLQHRGKDSYGYSYKTKKEILKINTVKNIGLIEDQYHDLNSTITTCIGHVRYSTSGESKENNRVIMDEVQPLTKRFEDSSWGDLSIVHNGNIPSIDGHDTTKLLSLISESHNIYDIERSLSKIMDTIPGSYCLIVQFNNELFAMKDRYGIRPLSYGYKGNNIHISSETNTLSGCRNITEVKSGEILKWNGDSLEPIKVYQHKEVCNYMCAFELIYFMDPESYYYNIKIENFRKCLSRKLVKKETLKGDDYIVVGVPKSGIIYGLEYAERMGLKYEQLILKTDNCSNGGDRTFTIIDNNERIKACKKKFKYDKEKIKGKKIIIIDDTIVRGNVIKQLIGDLWDCEASEIHIRIPAPPVIDICQLGIAIHKKEELLMNNKTIEEVKDELNVDSIVYNELTDLGENLYKECFGGGIHKELL